MADAPTNPPSSPPHRLSKPLIVLLLLVFLKQLGNGMVWSVIAVYGQSMGASAAVVGLMISAYGGARLLVNMPAGYASEKFGRRRMMAAGCGVASLSAFAVVLTSDVPAFFGCLLLMGIGSAFFITSALAAVADLGEHGRRLQDMSLYQGANMIGASMGPALGGLTAGLWGYDAPFFANGVIALCGLLAFAVMPWRESQQGVERVKPAPGQLRELARQGLAVGLMAFTIFYVRTASNWILMPLIAQTKFQLDLATIGLILTSGAIANLCVLTITPRLGNRFGRVRMIVMSSILTLIACGCLAFGDHSIFLWLSSILFGFGGGIATPTLTAYVADVAPVGQRGPAMGLLRTMQDLALILGPLFTGLLSDHLGLGFQGGLLGCLVFLGVATIVFSRGAKGL